MYIIFLSLVIVTIVLFLGLLFKGILYGLDCFDRRQANNNTGPQIVIDSSEPEDIMWLEATLSLAGLDNVKVLGDIDDSKKGLPLTPAPKESLSNIDVKYDYVTDSVSITQSAYNEYKTMVVTRACFEDMASHGDLKKNILYILP